MNGYNILFNKIKSELPCKEIDVTCKEDIDAVFSDNSVPITFLKQGDGVAMAVGVKSAKFIFTVLPDGHLDVRFYLPKDETGPVDIMQVIVPTLTIPCAIVYLIDIINECGDDLVLLKERATACINAKVPELMAEMTSMYESVPAHYDFSKADMVKSVIDGHMTYFQMLYGEVCSFTMAGDLPVVHTGNEARDRRIEKIITEGELSLSVAVSPGLLGELIAFCETQAPEETAAQ